MPYDPLKAQKALRTATAHTQLPGSEFIQEMAKLLKDADDDLRGVSDKIREAEANASRAVRDADDAKSALANHNKNGGAQLERAIAIITDIASSKKGAQAKAVAGLEELTTKSRLP